MTLICKQCGKEKANREFVINSRRQTVYRDVCMGCKDMPPEMLEALKLKVQASTISKMSGTYKPDAWHIRKGADAHLSVRSIG